MRHNLHKLDALLLGQLVLCHEFFQLLVDVVLAEDKQRCQVRVVYLHLEVEQWKSVDIEGLILTAGRLVNHAAVLCRRGAALSAE